MDKNNLLEKFNDKNLLVVGDSVSAQATIGDGKTYSTLLKEKYHLNNVLNAAIGGTTGTYMFKESNIYKEYWNNDTAIDGCRVVNNLALENKLKDFDYAIIAFGGNDQYFYPPLDEAHNEKITSLDQCHSFKNSYRFMINKMLDANPNMNVIILSCSYSEYDKTCPENYRKYNDNIYPSFRNALKEIADEYNIKYIDPWDHIKQYFDGNDTRYYYKDSIHLSEKGHEKLFEFIENNL